MNVTVIVATCGTDEWKAMGDEALESIKHLDVETIRIHMVDGTVAQARNTGIDLVRTEYFCILDADDTLSPDYFNFEPTQDVTVTSIRYKRKTTPTIPRVWQHELGRKGWHIGGICKAECLLDGNWIHVGSIVKKSAIKSIRFREYPVYEDYAFWLELQQAGLSFGIRPQSIYEASVRENKEHRNSSLNLRERNKVHEKIYEDITGKPFNVPSISIAIMAHPNRKENALKLLSKVKEMGFNHTTLVLDGMNDEWSNGETSLRAYSGDYHVILQDDAIISEDFYKNVIKAIKQKPDSLISFYTGTSRPFPTRIAKAVKEAEEQGASFLQGKTLFWGVGFVLPTKDILPMLNFVKNSTQPFDQRIGSYYKQHRKPVYYTYPSIVDHDYTLDSLVGYSIESVRKAHNYTEKRVDFNEKTIICDNI